jgi:hypothetical protein
MVFKALFQRFDEWYESIDMAAHYTQAIAKIT